MQKCFLQLVLCFVVLLTQFSCTSQLYIEATKPAEAAVTNDQWKVIVINRYNPDLLPFSKEKKVEVFADGAKEAINGVLDAITQDNTYLLVHTDSSGYKATAANEPLRPEQIKEIYKKYPHHLLLSLENFDTYLKQLTVREKDNNGNVSKTAHYTLVTQSSWTLYDSTGNVLDKAVLSKEELYNSREVISGLLAIGPALSNAGPLVNDLAWHTGNSYWSRLSPQQVTYARSYYSMKNFFPAAISMAAADWQSAIKQLKPMAESQNKKEAAKAAYNLAVVYEAMGQIEEAKYWASQAIRRNDKLAVLLLPDLEKY